MLFGFNAPTAGPLSAVDSLTRLAVEGEAMGFDYCTVSDHVVIPTDITATYPYSETGEFPAGARAERHEQLTEAMFILAVTSRMRVVTSVMVVPHRPAVLAAKVISSIDVLSKGRLTVGIGAGWLKEEFEALQLPDFAARGRATDDYLLAMKALWTQAEPSFQGEFTRFSNILFEPKPVQKPHPPIWVGGESGPALRRTARLGDGWYPIGNNPAFPLDSMPRYRAAVAKLRKLVADAGRDPASVALAYRSQNQGERLPARGGDGERRIFSGSAAEIVADLREMRAMGVHSVDFGFGGRTADAMLDEMRRFRDEVLAKV